MKKTLAMVMASVMALTLVFAGCSKPATPAPAPTPAPGAGAGTPAPAPAEKEVKFSIATTLNPDHPVAKSAQLFADEAKKNNASLALTLFPNSQLGGNNEMIESCQSGTVNIMPVANISGLSQFAARAGAISLPYVFQDADMLHRAIDGEPGAIIEGDLEKAGFKVLYWLDGGFRSVIANKEVKTPADLKGLKVRVQPNKVSTDALNAMGAVATPMNQGDVYSAIEQNMIQGWENNPQTLLSLKLYEVSKVFSFTNHFTAPDVLIMNNDLFNKLSDAQKKGLEDAAVVGQDFIRTEWEKNTTATIEELKKLGVTFVEIDNQDDFFKLTQGVRDEWAKANDAELLNKIYALKK